MSVGSGGKREPRTVYTLICSTLMQVIICDSMKTVNISAIGIDMRHCPKSGIIVP